MTDDKELNSSLRTQLTELNARVRSHMAAMWQMPFAYIGLIALSLSLADGHPRLLRQAGLVLALVGVFAIWAMAGWLEAAHRAVDNINHVEDGLALERTAKKKPFMHAVPHMLVVALGIIASVLVAVCKRSGA